MPTEELGLATRVLAMMLAAALQLRATVWPSEGARHKKERGADGRESIETALDYQVQCSRVASSTVLYSS